MAKTIIDETLQHTEEKDCPLCEQQREAMREILKEIKERTSRSSVALEIMSGLIATIIMSVSASDSWDSNLLTMMEEARSMFDYETEEPKISIH